jgi:hypothetical protein
MQQHVPSDVYHLCTVNTVLAASLCHTRSTLDTCLHCAAAVLGHSCNLVTHHSWSSLSINERYTLELRSKAAAFELCAELKMPTACVHTRRPLTKARPAPQNATRLSTTVCYHMNSAFTFRVRGMRQALYNCTNSQNHTTSIPLFSIVYKQNASS